MEFVNETVCICKEIPDQSQQYVIVSISTTCDDINQASFKSTQSGSLRFTTPQSAAYSLV